MPVSDVVLAAVFTASGVLGAAIWNGSAVVYGHWTKKRGDKAGADKTEQEVEIRWHEEWKKQCAENLHLSQQIEQLRNEISAIRAEFVTATNSLTDCQRERLDLSRLATHLASDRDRWREAAKSYEYLEDMRKINRVDEKTERDARARIEEAYRGEATIGPSPNIVDTALSIITADASVGSAVLAEGFQGE